MKKNKRLSMNPRTFFAVLLVIIAGWIAAGAYASSQHLEQLVFLDHYIDEYAEDRLTMQFYYITNKDDKNSINHIILGDIPGYVEEYHDPFMEEIPYMQRYGHHEVRILNVSLDLYTVRNLKEKMIFKEMTVQRSDGQSEVVDIGEIIIHPRERSKKTYLSQNMSMSGGNSTADIIAAEEKLLIQSLHPHMPVDDFQTLKIQLVGPEIIEDAKSNPEKLEKIVHHDNGKHYNELQYPLELDKGENLALILQNEQKVKYVLNSWLMVGGLDEYGKEIEFPAFLFHVPTLMKEDIKAIIEQKGQ